MTPYSMQWFCGLLCIDFLNVCSFKSLFFFQTPGGAKKTGPGSAATATATRPPLPVCRPAYNLEGDRTWHELWQLCVSADVSLPLKHKYSPKMGPEIDERSANKNRLSEERFEYSSGRLSGI